MIPTIGIMLATYTITRLFELISKPEIKVWVRIIGILAVLIIILCTVDIITAARAPSRFNPLHP